MVVNEKATKLAASAERVWTLFSTQHGQRLAMRGFVARMEFEGEGIGMVRTMHTEGHLGDTYVKERLDHYDEKNMEMMFQIVDTGGFVPFADYHGFAKVIRAGKDACILMLRSTFVPVDMSEEDARAISVKNFELLFANVRAAIAAGDI